MGEGSSALETQSIVLRKALLKLATYFRSVFQNSASVEFDWRVFCQDVVLFVVPDGKYDEPFSGNQPLAFLRRDVSIPIGICAYDSAGQPGSGLFERGDDPHFCLQGIELLVICSRWEDFDA